MLLGNTTRRGALKLLGAAGALLGRTGMASAQSTDDIRGLGLVSEVAVDHTSLLDVQGDYVYVSTEAGITVIDWEDPARPRIVAQADVPGVGIHENDITVDGDLLAVSSQGSGLAPLLGRSGEVTEEVAPEELGVHFFDVSDPTAPELLGTWEDPPAGIHNHALDGDTAYLCRAFPLADSSVRILDVSDPTNPTQIAKWRVEDEHPDLEGPVNYPHGVSVQDDLAYIAYWDAGCRVLDVSDPSDPVEVSSFGEAPDAAKPVEGTLSTVLSEPESEFTQRFMGLPGNAHTPIPSPDGNYVYVSEETFVGSPGGIRVFDVTNLDDPVEVTRIDPPSDEVSEFAHFFGVTSDRLHSAWIEAGVRVFDVSDPANPEEVARYDPEGFVSEIALPQRSFTIATFDEAGVVFLHPERGEQRPPTIGEDGGHEES